MGKFITDFEKAFPKQEEKKMVDLNDEQNVPNMTFQDMKDYFEGLKEAMTSELRKEMLQYLKPDNDKNLEGGKQNVSSSNLQCSEHDSE